MITKKSRMTHMRLDVRGALRNWSESEWRNCVTNKEGKMLTPTEVKDVLLEELAQGHDYIPLGDCDNFDPKKGCLGHLVNDGPTGREESYDK